MGDWWIDDSEPVGPWEHNPRDRIIKVDLAALADGIFKHIVTPIPEKSKILKPGDLLRDDNGILLGVVLETEVIEETYTAFNDRKSRVEYKYKVKHGMGGQINTYTPNSGTSWSDPGADPLRDLIRAKEMMERRR
jgi:hypothetical protein